MDFLDKHFFQQFSKIKPLINHWEMETAEKICFVEMLKFTSPEIALEIGSRKLGSLQIIASFSKLVYCMDISQSVGVDIKSRNLDGVQFIQGDSKVELPSLLSSLHSSELPTFIHIDGNHTTEGAQIDIHNCLSIKPTKRTVIMVHDSFNPHVRRAIRNLDLNSYTYLQFADIDFCPGILHSREVVKNEIWGGFSLFILEPNVLKEDFLIKNHFEFTYESLVKASDLYT